MAPVVNDNSPCREDPDGYLPDGFLEAPVTLLNATSSSDSDEDEEDADHAGYVLLSQSEADTSTAIEMTDEDDEQQQQHSLTHVAMEQEFLPWSDEEPESLNVDVAETKTGSVEIGHELTMDNEHIERIKSAMSGFALPTSAFPSWARVVPEERWKDHLLGLMGSKSGSDGTASRQPASVQRAEIESTPEHGKV